MPSGISFLYMVIAIGTRTGAAVNGCPVDIQSRIPIKREREFESLRDAESAPNRISPYFPAADVHYGIPCFFRQKRYNKIVGI